MIRITYASGREYEFDYEWLKLAPKLQLGGLRMFSPKPGTLIPLNSHTIAMIEDFGVEDELEDKSEIDESEEKSNEVESKDTKEEIKEEKKLSIEEKKEKILDEMKAKSECKHEVYQLFYQEVKTGPKGNQVISPRYFPVCEECGVRERYVKNDTLTDEDKANAKKWDK